MPVFPITKARQLDTSEVDRIAAEAEAKVENAQATEPSRATFIDDVYTWIAGNRRSGHVVVDDSGNGWVYPGDDQLNLPNNTAIVLTEYGTVVRVDSGWVLV